jgi:hypothetical protein
VAVVVVAVVFVVFDARGQVKERSSQVRVKVVSNWVREDERT